MNKEELEYFIRQESKLIGRRKSYRDIKTEKDDNLCYYQIFNNTSIQRIINKNPEINIKSINRRSLGYTSTLSRFMNYYNTTDIFKLTNVDINGFYTPNHISEYGIGYNVKNIKKSYRSKKCVIKICSIMDNLLGLRNLGRFEIDRTCTKEHNDLSKIRLIQIPDIFSISLVKTKGIDAQTIKTNSTNFIFDPEGYTILVNKDVLLNKVFMRENYSSNIRTAILRDLELYSYKFLNMFGTKPNIHFVSESEIYRYIRPTFKKDNITSLTEMMKIDKKVKSLVKLKKAEKELETSNNE